MFLLNNISIQTLPNKPGKLCVLGKYDDAIK